MTNSPVYSYQDFVADCHAYHRNRPAEAEHLRYGQHCFNKLYQHQAKMAESLIGTLLDPYDHDDRVPDFLYAVSSLWDQKAGYNA